MQGANNAARHEAPSIEPQKYTTIPKTSHSNTYYAQNEFCPI